LRLRHKYHAKPVVRDGFKFPSKKEGRYYDYFKHLRDDTNEVLFFLRQVPFHIPGNIRVVVDFVVFYTDGDIRIYDVKGVKTERFRMNQKLLAQHYPMIDLEIL